MKNIFILLLVTLTIINKGKAQYSTSYISYEYTEILALSIEISYSYSSGTYQPYSPSGFYGNALALLQARYDKNHAIISKEYYKLKELELINKYNQSTLTNYRNQRLNWVYQAGSTWNVGNETNTAKIINYCCEIYSYPSIKKEIYLLQRCQNEITRLKREDPNNYPLSKRYNSISKVLEKLANCQPEEIGKLNWESIEIEENSKNVTNVINYGSSATIAAITVSENISDIENNSYGTVKIGNQTWTTKNLNVAKFRNGDIIQQAKTNEEWILAGKNGYPVWCYFENKSENGKKYGKLYNWFAVIDPRGLAPVGWHIPNISEFQILIQNLGGEKLALSAIKGTLGWGTGNGNNSSNLNGIPGGVRQGHEASFRGGSSNLYWWSTSPHEKSSSHPQGLWLCGSSNQSFYLTFGEKLDGWNVRCVKD